MHSKITAVAVCTAVTVVCGGGYAVADTVITGKKVKNGSLTNADVKKGTIKLDRLSKGTQALVKKAGRNGANGLNGANGAPGANGQNGSSGTNGASAGSIGGNWTTIFRNTIGSPTATLLPGPDAPFGSGYLALAVNATPGNASDPNTEKASFGNEKDFAGDDVNGITQLGFRVLTTGENAAKGNPNMPNINIEIDPNLSSTASNFSTLAFLPAQSTSNQWSGYIDATTTPAAPSGTGFVLSGAAGTQTGCVLADPCTFSEMQTALEDGGDEAKVLSVAVTKGRDFAWQGGIDGLRVNNEVFDFEPTGTRTVLP